MPNYSQRVINNFVKGLITEAGEMTFPDGASVDELNCDLFRDGTRRRRRGIGFEENYEDSTFSITPNTTISVGTWRSVSGNVYKEYLVVQVGRTIYFYDKGELPFSAQEVAGSIDLSTYDLPGQSAADYKCDFASIKGYLVVVNKVMNPFYVEETSTGVFTVTTISERVRDFKYVGDTEDYDGELASASVSDARKYDTYNTGWSGSGGSGARTTYISDRSAWPPLTIPWFSGKDASGNFSTAEFRKVEGGTSLLGNGRFIYSLWNIDREAKTGFVVDGEEETTRFSCVAAFSERVFFSGLDSRDKQGKIYFSPILDNINDIGRFFQRNDPTTEVFSDLLATDGGVIVIPDASEIKALYGYRNNIFAFAENGVWQISGVDGEFNATSYSISRITNNGIEVRDSLVAAEGVPFWWSRYGIHTISFDDFGNAREENLSIATIQTFFEAIDPAAKEKVISAYDRINKRVYWMYPSNGETIDNKYREILVLDISLQAFFPWRISDNDNYILGAAFYSGFGSDTTIEEVVANTVQVQSNTEDVIATITSPLSNGVALTFLVYNSTTGRMTMAFINKDTLLDWDSDTYLSYAETGYDFIGDLVLKKTAPYLVVYTRETETGWTGTELVGYTPVRESSLLVSAYWDFKKSSSSDPQEVYRRRQPIIVDSNDLSTFDSPATVLTSRIKVRGRGRSMRVRFESSGSKDFILIGHGLIADAASGF